MKAEIGLRRVQASQFWGVAEDWSVGLEGEMVGCHQRVAFVGDGKGMVNG